MTDKKIIVFTTENAEPFRFYYTDGDWEKLSDLGYKFRTNYIYIQGVYLNPQHITAFKLLGK